MLFATAAAQGKDRGGKPVPAATRLYEWSDRSRPPRLLYETDKAPSPSFLAYSKTMTTLFVTTESPGEGQVTALLLEGETLVPKGSRTTNGNAAVHAALDQTERWLAVANYRAERVADDAGIALFPVQADRGIGAIAASESPRGSGRDRSRQSSPHTHCVMFSPDNKLLAAVDLGTDGLWLYHFDAATGDLRLAREISLPAGSGPRHCVFHPSKPFVYICGELDSTLMTLRYDSGAGTAELIDLDAATGAAHMGRNYPSGITISPDGHYVMLANRGTDTIAIFWIDPETGMARLRDEVPSGGSFPRAIRLDRTGRMLAVANQKSGNVALFERDFASGRLTAMARGKVELPSAMDVIFLDQ
ncbi:lactonase family protein [Rhizobium sp.]